MASEPAGSSGERAGAPTGERASEQVPRQSIVTMDPVSRAAAAARARDAAIAAA